MKVIAVEGIIGAGKTTLLKFLEKELASKIGKKVVVIYEPVDEWKETGVLDEFYKGLALEDTEKKSLISYKFQTFAYLSRVRKIRESFAAQPDADIYILERSLYSDRYFFTEMLFETGQMLEKEYKLYLNWWEEWKRTLPLIPDQFVYLVPTIENCMARIKKRDRTEETGIAEDYQLGLKAKHDQFFRDKKVWELENNQPLSIDVLQTFIDFFEL